MALSGLVVPWDRQDLVAPDNNRKILADMVAQGDSEVLADMVAQGDSEVLADMAVWGDLEVSADMAAWGDLADNNVFPRIQNFFHSWNRTNCDT